MKKAHFVTFVIFGAIFPCIALAQSSGTTVPPPPYCTSSNAGALYTNTSTSPATVYTCSYYNLSWQWVVNPSYGGLVYYPTLPSTCSGALPVFVAGWPNTKMYECVYGVPTIISASGSSFITSLTTTGSSGPATVASGVLNIPQYAGGGVSQILAGTNVSISPSGGTGVVTISATGGGGVDSVLYNPTGTGYLWTGSSRIVDDNNSLGVSYTATAVNCTDGVKCGVDTLPQNIFAGQRVWINRTFSPGFLVDGAGSSTYYYGDGNGIYTVLPTGLSSTHFEFAYTANMGTGTGGLIEDADWFAPYVTAKKPFFNGHGETIIRSSGTVQLAVANYSALYHDYCASATPTSPKYFIIADFYNDISGGTRTADQVEADLGALWQAAHADGCIVVQGTTPISTVNGFTDTAIYRWVNVWVREQGKSSANVSSGLYVDILVDLSGKCSSGQICYWPNVSILGPTGVNIWATAFNESLSAQTTVPDSYPGLFENNTAALTLYLGNGERSDNSALAFQICDSGQSWLGPSDPRCPFFVDVDRDFTRVDALRIKNLTPSTAPLCASGTNGEVTNVGCSGGTTGVVGGSVTVSSGTQAANTCSTNATATDTGLTTSGANSRPTYNYASDPSAITGWGLSGGMVFQAWESAADTITWHVCNQTSTSITYGAITFNLGAN